MASGVLVTPLGGHLRGPGAWGRVCVKVGWMEVCECSVTVCKLPCARVCVHASVHVGLGVRVSERV